MPADATQTKHKLKNWNQNMLKVETWHVLGTFPVPCKLERGQTGNSRKVSATLLRNLSFGTWNYETTLHIFSKYQIHPFGIIKNPISVSHKRMRSRERERERATLSYNKQQLILQGFNNRTFHSFSLLLPVSVYSSSGGIRFLLLQLQLQTRFW